MQTAHYYRISLVCAHLPISPASPTAEYLSLPWPPSSHHISSAVPGIPEAACMFSKPAASCILLSDHSSPCLSALSPQMLNNVPSYCLHFAPGANLPLIQKWERACYWVVLSLVPRVPEQWGLGPKWPVKNSLQFLLAAISGNQL